MSRIQILGCAVFTDPFTKSLGDFLTDVELQKESLNIAKQLYFQRRLIRKERIVSSAGHQPSSAKFTLRNSPELHAGPKFIKEASLHSISTWIIPYQLLAGSFREE